MVVVHVDVVIRPRAANIGPELAQMILSFLHSRGPVLYPGDTFVPSCPPALVSCVEKIRICDLLPNAVDLKEDRDTRFQYPTNGNEDAPRNADFVDFKLHLHALHANEVVDEPLDADADTAGDGAQLPACEITAMPNRGTDGLWETLVYGGDVKQRLLRYAEACMLLSKRGVDPNLVSWNRIVLLHGPPGTGKTSLCKAMCHKLAVRMKSEFQTADLVEVNAHSLFSRWFSESGKQVMLLFRRIREMAEDPKCLVCVLIDEVESLAAARNSAANGNEPSDAIRVVNALLTQLDALRRLPNVLVLATSNITGTIDLAFVDRADLKILIPPPPPEVKLAILESAVQNLLRCGVVETPMAALTSHDQNPDAAFPDDPFADPRIRAEVRSVVDDLEAFLNQRGATISGRTLRKLPMLAFTQSEFSWIATGDAVPFHLFITALRAAGMSDAASRCELPS